MGSRRPLCRRYPIHNCKCQTNVRENFVCQAQGSWIIGDRFIDPKEWTNVPVPMTLVPMTLWQQRQQRLNVFVKPNEQWQACLNHCHGEKRSDDIQQQKSKVIMSEQQNNSPIQAAVNALNGLCAFSRSEWIFHPFLWCLFSWLAGHRFGRSLDNSP